MNAENPERPEPAGEPLPMWTIYDHPSDYPNNFVARQIMVYRDGSQTTTQIMICPHLYILREEMVVRGLTCIGRQSQDDPVIVEVWL